MTFRTVGKLLFIATASINVALSLSRCSLDQMTAYSWVDELTAVKEFTIYDVAWSPGGNDIAMVGYHGSVGQDILIYNIERNDVRSLIGEKDAFLANTVTWSPDGEYLTVSGGYWTDQTKNGIWLVPVSGKPPTFLADGTDSAWSPDGNMIAIGDNLSLESQLKVLDVRNGEERILLNVPKDRTMGGIHPEWSPTSDVIAFTVEEHISNKQARINLAYLLDLNGLEPKRLFTEQKWVDDVSWFPEGNWLVLMIRSSERGGVYFAPAEGSCFKRLLPGGITGSYVDVSPDGDQLIVNRFGTPYIVNLREAAMEGNITFPLSCP